MLQLCIFCDRLKQSSEYLYNERKLMKGFHTFLNIKINYFIVQAIPKLEQLWKFRKTTSRRKRALVRKAAKGPWKCWSSCTDPQLSVISHKRHTSGLSRSVERRKQLFKRQHQDVLFPVKHESGGEFNKHEEERLWLDKTQFKTYVPPVNWYVNQKL